MPLLSSRSVRSSEDDFGGVGLHHLHSHRPAASDTFALDLLPSRLPAAVRKSEAAAARTQLFGVLSLLVVAFLWGSYSPVLKFLFTGPSPPSAALMTAAQALLAAAFLLASSAQGALAAAAGQAGRDGKTGAAGLRLARAVGAGAGLAALLRPVLRAVGVPALVSAASWRGRRREPLFPPKQPPGVQPHLNPQGHTRAASHSQLVGTSTSPLTQGSASASGSAGQLQMRGSDPGAAESGWPGAPTAAAGGGSAGTGVLAGGVAVAAPPAGPGPHRSPLERVPSSGSGSAGQGTVFGSGGGAAAAALVVTSSGSSSGGRHPGRSTNLLTTPLSSLAAAGIELGAYNFFAVALGTWGVQLMSATKVAFLGQATSLITPLLVAASGQRVAAVVWAACLCGALGGAMVALDGSGRAAAAVGGTTAVAVATAVGTGTGQHGGALSPPGLLAAAASLLSGGGDGVEPSLHPGAGSGGVGGSRAMRLESSLLGGGGGDGSVSDGLLLGGGGSNQVAAVSASVAGLAHSSLPPALSPDTMGANYVLASCLFYALGTVRVGVHSSRFAPLDLATAGAVGYAALAVVWLLVEILGTPTGGRADYVEVGLLLRDYAALACVLWAGFGPGALSSYLQMLGQRIVPAAKAQMLYSSTPLWSALIARVLLHGADGAMGPLAWAGGGVMLSASLGASLLDRLGGGGAAGGGGTGDGGGGKGGTAGGTGLAAAGHSASMGEDDRDL